LQLAWSLITRLVPSLATTVVSIGLIAVAAITFAIVAASIYYGIKGWEAASTQSGAALEAHWGALGTFWRRAGDALSAIWNHPLLAWVHGGSSKQAGDAAENESLRITNKSRKRRGLKPLKSQQGHEDDDERNETADDVRRREAKAKANPFGKPSTFADEMKKLQAKKGAPMSFATGGGSMGFGPAESRLRGEQSADVQAAQGKVDTLETDIQSLQDQKRGTDDKDLKKTIGEKIIAKQRLLRAARRELAAVKKLAARQERDATRAEKTEERDAARAQKAEDKSQGQVQDNEFEIKKAGIEDRYSGHTGDLDRELKTAKEAGDAAKIKRLTFDIGHNNARKQLEIELMSADREKDAKVRSSLRKKAQNAYRLAQNAAGRDARNAALDAEEERQDTIRKGTVDVKKAELQNATDAKIAPLDEELSVAKEAADFARIRSITLQIESLKAEQQYSEDSADATLQQNVEKRRQMERLAQARKNGALQKAGFAADKAVRDAQKDKNGDKNQDRGAREALARMASASGLMAMQNARALRSDYGASKTGSGVPSLANFGQGNGDLNRERTAKVASMSQSASGNWEVQFEKIKLPYQGIGDVEVN